VEHSIAIGDVAQDFQRIYSDATRLMFFTKNELLREDANNDYGSEDYESASESFPQPLPDMYIDHMYGEAEWNHYLAEVWHSTVPFWVYRKRIQYYIEYVDEEACEEAFGGELPPVLLICDTPTLQRRVQRYLRRMADSIDEDELRFLVTSREALRGVNKDVGLWTVIQEEGNVILRLIEISNAS
jgi:hypothetical protein